MDSVPASVFSRSRAAAGGREVIDALCHCDLREPGRVGVVLYLCAEYLVGGVSCGLCGVSVRRGDLWGA